MWTSCRSAVSLFTIPALIVVCGGFRAGRLNAADAIVSTEAAIFELCAGCPKPQIHILAASTSKGAVDVNDQPAVAQVLLAGVRDDGFRQAFSAAWMADAKGLPRAIDLTYSGGPVLPAGSYDVYLELQPQKNPAAARLKITIVKPPPKISVYSKIVVERTWWLPFWSIEDKSPQVLDETSWKSGATGLNIRLVNPAAQGAKFTTGSLAFTNLPATIDSGKHLDNLAYRTVGGFPLGVTTGAMKVFANEAPEALASFDFEVHNQVARLYLALILVAGLASSSVVKVKLQQNIERDQAWLDAKALLERVTSEASKHENKEFLAAYQEKQKELENAMADMDAASINSAKLALDTAWKEALDALAKLRQPEMERYQQLDDALRVMAKLDLPAAERNQIASARTIYLGAKKSLDQDDFTAVKAARESAIEGVAQILIACIQVWKPDVRRTLEALSAATTGISAQLAKQIAARAPGVIAGLDKLNQAAVLTSPEELKQTALDLHSARNAVRQFFGDTASNQRIEMVYAEGQIARANESKWKAQPFQKVENASKTLEALLRTFVEAPNAVKLATELAQLHGAWSASLAAQFQVADGEVQALVDSANYAAALALTLRKLQSPNVNAAFESPKLRTVSKHGSDTPAAAFAWSSLFPSGELIVLHIEAPGDSAQVSVTPTRVTVARQLWLSKLRMTAAVGVIAMLGGYGLFSAAWVGTFADFSTAFFWAFGLDLTLDAALKMVRKS